MTDAGSDKDVADGDEVPSEMDPPGGHDRAALEDAAEKMHLSSTSDDDEHPDPPGGHDPAALEDAAHKMGAGR
jgi:hypothetical protein